MNRAYGARPTRGWHPPGDIDVAIFAAVVVLGVWTQSLWWVGVVAVASMFLRNHLLLVVLCVLFGAAGVWRSTSTWAGAHPRQLGEFAGWVTIVGDPTPFGPGLRVTVEIGGERFDAWAYGSARRRLSERQAGERVYVEGQRRAISSGARRAQLRHVVGRLDLQVVGDWREGSPLYRASSRVRIALRGAAERAMPGDDAALFTGLVIGDDSRQSVAVVEAFRSSGLSHLTAVSGQNVAFVVAAASPLLRRLRSWWRWAATLALIGWFMTLTRFEPSVMRAGVMAMLACSAYLFGRQVTAPRLLWLTVALLVLVDPMLVWSVGFWLSTGATAGVCLAGPRLAGVLPGPGWLRFPLSVTLGAQLGVALPSWLVFHRLPLVSLPANLIAVPVAGFVMLCGIPAGLLAAVVPTLTPIVMGPCMVATRWVAAVADVAAAAEPSPRVAAGGWLAIATLLVLLARSSDRRSQASTDGVPM